MMMFQKYRFFNVVAIGALLFFFQGCGATHTKKVQATRLMGKQPVPVAAAKEPWNTYSANQSWVTPADNYMSGPVPMDVPMGEPMGAYPPPPFAPAPGDGYAMTQPALYSAPEPGFANSQPPVAESSELLQRLTRLKEDMKSLKQRALALKGEQTGTTLAVAPTPAVVRDNALPTPPPVETAPDLPDSLPTP